MTPADRVGEERGGGLLRARIEWERANPRPDALVRAERAIVRTLRDGGFGRQYQVTRQDGFEIAVDELIVSVRYSPVDQATA